MERRADGLEPGKVEATAAVQMDEEVPPMSGSHGNLADRHHRRTVGRELRVMIATGLTHFTFLFMRRQNILFFWRRRNRLRCAEKANVETNGIFVIIYERHTLSLSFILHTCSRALPKNKMRYSY